MKTNVKIHLNDGEIKLQCEVKQMESSFVNLKEILPNTIEAMLLEKQHSSLQTQFDLTDLDSCWILLFDENKEFVTVKPHFCQSEAQYQVFITEPYMIVLPVSSKYPFERTLSFEIDEEENEREVNQTKRKLLEIKLKEHEKIQIFKLSERLKIYKQLYPLYSDEELIDCFNQKTKINIFNRFLSGLRFLIYDELMKRAINVDCITSEEGGNTAISYKDEIMLINRNDQKRIVIKEDELRRIKDRRIGQNIRFVFERELEVEFSTLIINVKSIEHLYPGGYKEFFMTNDFYGITNGYLFIAYEMMSIPSGLYNIIDNILEPLGFKEGHDYVFGMDENTCDLDGNPIKDKQIPWCEGADWIHSIIAKGHGNKVWHSDFDREQELFIKGVGGERPWTQNWSFWYTKHPLLKGRKLKAIRKVPPFDLESKRFDLVELDEFYTPNSSNMPLHIGTQFGVFPKAENAPSDYTGHIAILNKSQFSGHVAGVSIYYFEYRERGERLLSIENKEGRDEELIERFNKLTDEK